MQKDTRKRRQSTYRVKRAEKPSQHLTNWTRKKGALTPGFLPSADSSKPWDPTASSLQQEGAYQPFPRYFKKIKNRSVRYMLYKHDQELPWVSHLITRGEGATGHSLYRVLSDQHMTLGKSFLWINLESWGLHFLKPHCLQIEAVSLPATLECQMNCRASYFCDTPGQASILQVSYIPDY